MVQRPPLPFCQTSFSTRHDGLNGKENGACELRPPPPLAPKVLSTRDRASAASPCSPSVVHCTTSLIRRYPCAASDDREDSRTIRTQQTPLQVQYVPKHQRLLRSNPMAAILRFRRTGPGHLHPSSLYSCPSDTHHHAKCHSRPITLLDYRFLSGSRQTQISPLHLQ